MARKTALPILTPAESEIMETLWRLEAATVHEIVAALPRKLAYNSVSTVVRILEDKGYVRHQQHPERPRAHVYSAKVRREQARKHHVRDLVTRLFQGQTAELATGLLEHEDLSASELEEIRALVQRRIKERRSKNEKNRP